jgi:hypothetical protein
LHTVSTKECQRGEISEVFSCLNLALHLKGYNDGLFSFDECLK